MLREWRAGAVDPGGGKPTGAEWTPVTVPGRPDDFAGEACVAYRTTFTDPRDPDEAMACLELQGCYAHARVWLNGELVAKSDTYFAPIRVPFEPQAENELVVECREPDDRFGGIHDTDRVPDADAVPGIWWDASLSTHPETFVVALTATPRVPDLDDPSEADGLEAAIDATVEVYAGNALDERLTLTTRPAGERRGRGMMDRAPVEALAGDRVTVEQTIDLRDPSLWWPRELGDQHRYQIRAKLGDDVATTTTGLASITRDEETLVVNGQPVPIRGVILQDGTPADVDRATSVNANLVRAHAHALSPATYDACDEAGLLVWQDLPLTGPGLFDIERGKRLARRVGDVYGAHPSLAAVAVHDDPVESLPDRLGGGVLDRLRLRWRAWRTEYDRGPAEAVAEAVPDPLAVFPVVGGPGTRPDAAAIYPGWDYGRAGMVDWLVGQYPSLGHVVGEFGAGSLADADPEELAGFDRAKHDAAVGSDSDDIAASQAFQAEVLRRVASSLRAGGAAAAVACALRDTGDAGMGVYTRDGEPKAAADALTEAFEPVAIIRTEPDDRNSPVMVVNDTPTDFEGTLTWTAGESSGSADLSVESLGTTIVDSVSAPADASEIRLTLSSGSFEVSTTDCL